MRHVVRSGVWIANRPDGHRLRSCIGLHEAHQYPAAFAGSNVIDLRVRNRPPANSFSLNPSIDLYVFFVSLPLPSQVRIRTDMPGRRVHVTLYEAHTTAVRSS